MHIGKLAERDYKEDVERLEVAPDPFREAPAIFCLQASLNRDQAQA